MPDINTLPATFEVYSDLNLTDSALGRLAEAVRCGYISVSQLAVMFPIHIIRDRELLEQQIRMLRGILTSLGIVVVSNRIAANIAYEHQARTRVRKQRRKHNPRSRTYLLDLYNEDVESFELLDQSEVDELSRRAENGDIEARNTIVLHNLRLARQVASWYTRKKDDPLDFIQAANVGLIEAANRFDYRKGFAFSTYARWWIRQNTGRYLKNYGETVRTPVYAQDLQNKIYRATAQLTGILGREPTAPEIAVHIDMPDEVGKIKRMIRLMRWTTESLDDPAYRARKSGGTPQTVEEITPSRAFLDPEQSLRVREELDETLKNVRGMWRFVTLRFEDRESTIFQLRYGLDCSFEGKTLEEIGQKFDITRERIRQLLVKMWKELTPAFDGKEEEWFRDQIDRIKLMENLLGVIVDV